MKTTQKCLFTVKKCLSNNGKIKQLTTLRTSHNIMSTLFTKIVQKEIPADILFQDNEVTVFRDIAPQAAQHILIIPNKPIPTVNDVTTEDQMVLGKLFLTAAKMAKDLGLADDGYRLLVNCNKHAGQDVFHLHMHLMGGEPLGPMRTK